MGTIATLNMLMILRFPIKLNVTALNKSQFCWPQWLGWIRTNTICSVPITVKVWETASNYCTFKIFFCLWAMILKEICCHSYPSWSICTSEKTWHFVRFLWLLHNDLNLLKYNIGESLKTPLFICVMHIN